MAAVPVTLLDRPPSPGDNVEALPDYLETPELPAIAPDEYTIVVDTDTLVRACSCKSSSDAPYNN